MRVVFLDRDGTINVDRGYVYRNDEWEFAPGAVEGMKLLRAAGFSLAVVTNQSGVARGYYTADDVIRLHKHMRTLLEAEGASIGAVAYCPHGPEEDCDCRKPRAGMAKQIVEQLGEPFDATRSWMVGDKPTDVGFGAALGMRTALLTSRYWQADGLQPEPTKIAGSLLEAAEFIVKESA